MELVVSGDLYRARGEWRSLWSLLLVEIFMELVVSGYLYGACGEWRSLWSLW